MVGNYRSPLYTTNGENMPTTSPRMGNKIKKSFSISTESDAFIRRSCKERKLNSESETLDALLSELRTIRQREAVEAAYTDYYDELGADQTSEEHDWATLTQPQIIEEAR